LTHNAPILTVCVSMLLSACANMSGMGGSAEYGCKAPQGVQCDSVSGNYYNALQNNLPSQRQHPPTGAAGNGMPSGSQSVTMRSSSTAEAAPLIDKTGPDDASPLALAASPLRSQARVLRLWFKPWEDADHDLYDQGFVYVQIDSGRWLIDHAQQRIRDAYAPIRPPRAAAVSATIPAKPVDPRFFGAGASDSNASPLVSPFSATSKPLPGATDLPIDDNQ
jgi:conjugal transfer pilus assembly protein TraV